MTKGIMALAIIAIIIALFLTVFITKLSMLYQTYRASSLQPAESLRYE